MKKTLVVMAAGMGSRFGGLKQITPVDCDGNFIIDYSVYDAKRAGFDKVVFVIKEENLKDFQTTIGKRLEKQIEVAYAFQRIEDIPSQMDVSSRQKPWGTVQAVLCARPYVDGSFVVINADDFYGENAYVLASEFLDSHQEPYTYACISYPFGVTKSDVGAVKRGVLTLKENKITEIVESSIEAISKQKALSTPLDGSSSFEIDINAPVSMNMFAFQNDMFELLEEYFQEYFQQDEEKILSGEALLPDCIKQNISSGVITIYNVVSNGKWLGMTYASDLEFVKKEFKKFKEEKCYPMHLWR